MSSDFNNLRVVSRGLVDRCREQDCNGVDAGRYVRQRHVTIYSSGFAHRHDHRMPVQFLRFRSIFRHKDEPHGGGFGSWPVIRHRNGHIDGFGSERQSGL